MQNQVVVENLAFIREKAAGVVKRSAFRATDFGRRSCRECSQRSAS